MGLSHLALTMQMYILALVGSLVHLHIFIFVKEIEMLRKCNVFNVCVDTNLKSFHHRSYSLAIEDPPPLFLLL